ncbi:MAG: DoxX-like family protein [Ottowia sp.]|uniref:DoxX-like family protein n=1 Tax=Ottowia sp. TaxID=1898956 RepID=UPI0039E39729
MTSITTPAEPPELRWLRGTLVFVWLWTAVVSVVEWHGQSLALLAGLPPAWAGAKPWLIGTGALLDAVLGVWLWWRPGRTAYAAALAALAGMTLLATVIEPGWWLHPFGPLSKNAPIAAALVLLWRRAPARP